ncbi:manno(fructo)kinase [Candidatus Terasakiella magnetica]|uniref:Manno(Fructo)kinase n=1 Tax=Candidatus Terasakiella magnetica TaxID=1867952 RepID=A0A1C3RKA0_9PROT|nr:ROK family protein [Candidatus Terasakiella magnetica]SCA57673.1 manno(fructo)kinase [Candidatus Terasakiella magnetica]
MRIGIDLGGTKTEILCLGTSGEELLRKRIPTPQGNYEKTLTSIRDLVLSAEEETGQKGSLGIGIPGTISHKTGLVKNANSIWLIGHPFQKDLSQALDRDVRMSNDANCFALSEATDGAAQDYKNVFGVILGTGTDGGLVVNKQVIDGINGVTGEWGHNSLPWPQAGELPGEDCYCGLQGCIETFISGPALERTFKNICGTAIEAKDISSLPHDISEPVFHVYEDRLARALASIINVFDPDAIVLGGGLSNIDRWYETVPKIWQKWVFGNECDTQLLKATHGDASGVRGAAWLWPEED